MHYRHYNHKDTCNDKKSFNVIGDVKKKATKKFIKISDRSRTTNHELERFNVKVKRKNTREFINNGIWCKNLLSLPYLKD